MKSECLGGRTGQGRNVCAKSAAGANQHGAAQRPHFRTWSTFGGCNAASNMRPLFAQEGPIDQECLLELLSSRLDYHQPTSAVVVFFLDRGFALHHPSYSLSYMPASAQTRTPSPRRRASEHLPPEAESPALGTRSPHFPARAASVSSPPRTTLMPAGSSSRRRGITP